MAAYALHCVDVLHPMAYAVKGRNDCEQHCGNRQDDHDNDPLRQCVSPERLRPGSALRHAASASSTA